jgi:hypothetical protein
MTRNGAASFALLNIEPIYASAADDITCLMILDKHKMGPLICF